jgi:hypothetical protein
MYVTHTVIHELEKETGKIGATLNSTTDTSIELKLTVCLII